MLSMHRHRPASTLAVSSVAAGVLALASALPGLQSAGLDARLLLLAFFALSLGNAVFVKVPRVGACVAASDLLVFLAVLAYGYGAGVPLAALAAALSSLRFDRRGGGALFVAGLAATATVLPAWVAPHLDPPLSPVARSTDLVLLSLLLAASRAALGSLPVALGEAAASKVSAWRAYAKTFAWSLVTYFAASSVAGLAFTLTAWVRFDFVLGGLAAVGVVYLTVTHRAGSSPRDAKGAPQSSALVRLPAGGEDVFRGAFENAQVGMALVSGRGKWLRVNPALCEFLGRTEHELLSTDIQNVTHPDDLGHALAGLRRLLAGSESGLETEVRHLRAGGEHVWAHWSVGCFASPDIEERRLILQVQDVTERKLSEEQLLHDAFHDALTKLPNRALFIDHVKLSISRARRSGERTFAVLFLDLDRFKIVNDSLGHMAGDQLLVGVARRLETCLREGDTVARVGGDEFTILLEDLQDLEEALSIAERIQREVSAPFQLDGHEVFTTLSIGIAKGGAEYTDPEDILRDADTAMYRAKVQGKARHEVFDKAMHAFAVNLLQIETDLRKALDRGEFFLNYQPIVALGDFRLCGFEALVRWQHPERGLVSPLDFIPVAEDTGQIVAIGEWALHEACKQMSRWHRRFPLEFPFFISVNLSSKQFTAQSLIEQVGTILEKTKLNPRNLKLEITESAVMENIDKTTEMLRLLRALGVQLSIDDFGTGYSSLSYLHRFPIDTLKIDRSFVTRMVDNPENIEIVRTIVMLAQTLGMDVVAEGVETKEQLALLRQLGCEYGQGYYFSKPVGSFDAERIIAETCAPDPSAEGGEAEAIVNDRVKSMRLIPSATDFNTGHVV